MLDRPGAVTAIVSQNGNAYEDGLGGFWDGVKKFWENPKALRDDLKQNFTSFETTKWQVRAHTFASRVYCLTILILQYVNGAPNPDTIAPEAYNLDYYLMTRPGNADIQMDIIYDYRTNLKLYPEFHKYFRQHKPPVLAVWGKNDAIFIPAGAEAYKKDNPNADVKFVDSGHFPL